MATAIRKRIPVLVLALLASATLLAPGIGAQGAPPQTINYQGHLLDSEGNPLSGNYDFVFSIWDEPVGGTMLWIESFFDLYVSGGLFQVVLGETSPITADIVAPPPTVESFFDIWVEISVDGELIEPRTKLASAPYALSSHRVNGDITTSPGGLSMGEQLGLNYEKIRMNAGGGESYREMESSDGFSITTAYDKATPQLYQTMARKRGSGGSDSLVMMGLIESDTIWFSASAGNGNGTTSRIDKSSPLLHELLVESTDGMTTTRKIDRSTPLLYNALAIHKETETDSVLAQTSVDADGAEYSVGWWNQSLLPGSSLDSGRMFMSYGGDFGGLGGAIGGMSYSGSDTLKALISTLPTEEVSLSMSSGNASMGQKGGIELLTLGMEEVSFCMAREEAETLDSVVIRESPTSLSMEMSHEAGSTLPMEEVAFSMNRGGGGLTQGVQIRESPTGTSLEMELESSNPMPMEEISFSMNRGGAAMQSIQIRESPTKASMEMGVEAVDMPPIEEVSFSMSRQGGGLREEIDIRESPSRMGLEMMKASALMPGEAPADTNVQIYATAEGGTMMISNISESSGDGLAITVSADDNSLRLRNGGANTGVLLQSDPVSGGKVGINNEAPSEELSVGGDICASGTIGVCSDVRFKKDIAAISGALAAIERLRGVRFAWKRDEFPGQHFADRPQVGFVAQEIVEVVPEVVSQGSDGYYSIDYGKLTPLLVEAIKELSAQNARLSAIVAELQAKMDRTESQDIQ